MRAARWYGAGDIRIDDVPVPVPRDGQVLVAVERVGLCGSDVEEYRHGPVAIPPAAVPVILGHEVVGTVADCPGGQWPLGTRVIPDVVVGCGVCWWCRRHQEGLCPQLLVRGQQQDGGLARYMLADAATCVAVPDTLDADTACFAEPAAVAVRALAKAGDLTGAVVAVIGAGPVGLLTAQAALHSPAAAVVVCDPVPTRRALAGFYGAEAHPPDAVTDAVHALTGGRGADVVIECSGAPTAPAAAVDLSRRGATIVLVGFRAGPLNLPWLPVVLGERHLLGSAAHLWDTDVTAAVALLARGHLDPAALLSGHLTLDAVPAGFHRLTTDPTVVKLVVTLASDQVGDVGA